MSTKTPTPGPTQTPALAPGHSDVWQIFPDETPEHFQAFREYRDMAYPDGYSGRWVRRHMNGARELVATKYGRQWSKDAFRQMAEYFRWTDRARAFDLQLDHVASSKLMDEAAQYRRAHLRRMAKLAQLGEAEIDRHLRRAEALNRNPSDVIPITRPTETLELLDRATKTERLILGESTENIGGAQAPVKLDLSGLSMAELEALERLTSKVTEKG